MPRILIQESASYRLDEIYRYTRDRWGAEQANQYINGLFRAFDDILVHQAQSRPVPSEFGVDGYYFHFQRHIVYWRRLRGGDVGIVTILHERMHQIDRFREDESP